MGAKRKLIFDDTPTASQGEMVLESTPLQEPSKLPKKKTPTNDPVEGGRNAMSEPLNEPPKLPRKKVISRLIRPQPQTSNHDVNFDSDDDDIIAFATQSF